MRHTLRDAYFAGLIDGEGHIGFCSAGGGMQPIIQVKMTCLKTITALQKHFGCGVIQPMKPGKAGYQTQYKWRVRYSLAAPVIERIRPFLITKADAADLVLNAPVTKRGSRRAPVVFSID